MNAKDLYGEFYGIIKALNRKRVRYALIGGIAVGYYTQPRFTNDIDLLTIPSEAEKIRSVLTALGYEESAQPWTFRSTMITLRRFARVQRSQVVTLDLLIGMDAFHKEVVVKAIPLRSHNGMVKIARREDLIALKKKRNSEQDRVDIKKLKSV